MVPEQQVHVALLVVPIGEKSLPMEIRACDFVQGNERGSMLGAVLGGPLGASKLARNWAQHPQHPEPY